MTVERAVRMIAGVFVLLSLALGLLGLAVLVPVHSVRRAELVSVGIHQLVPDDDDLEEGGNEVGVGPRGLKSARYNKNDGALTARLKPCPFNTAPLMKVSPNK